MSWFYLWHDRTNQRGLVTRDRVAYLLRAARSRRDPIKRTERGYRIGTLELIRPVQ